ncbi:D-2-hydroxyacid dehydrogenase family protein [Acidisoma cladoniae]|jgi:phosphoglycerate dehydrogenase-like enzyme|uniref:D-2-hydroxyacid dehydrogenase family protein n=1 Tax=Acidisoma cladoniae TaxID=3040935 RepID=UPI002551A64E|nr:D-2-hydroxyacid dehydrogenase family protein [Acidisoma sp. PAMC 29798]
MTKIAVLDDWQGIARQSADWSKLEARAEVVFFDEAFADEDAAAAGLAEFDILLSMRERTPMPRSLIQRLPKLAMLGITGAANPSLDVAACTERGIAVCNTVGYGSGAFATAELALGLLIAAARGIPQGDAGIRQGEFQHGVPVGISLAGKTLGLIGLGRLGARMARYGEALDMTILAWSQNLTAETAQEAGAELVSKDELLEGSDAISLHLVLSPRSRGIIGAADIARMKPGAILINTSRGPLVDEAALIAAVTAGRIVAALDVFDREPLPADHPLRTAPNTVLTPHLGYGVAETWAVFYPQSVENAVSFLDGKPLRVINPEVLAAG